MVLTDGVHLVSNSSLAELHEAAALLGLKREWFQDHRIPHYDLTTSRMRKKATSLFGMFPSRTLVEYSIRKQVKQRRVYRDYDLVKMPMQHVEMLRMLMHNRCWVMLGMIVRGKVTVFYDKAKAETVIEWE